MSRLARLLEHAGGWIDRNPRPVLILFTILHTVVSLRMMAIKPFWMDELYTFYVAKAASVPELFAMIRDVVDHQPPPFFLLTRAFLKLPLAPETAARLPELMGYWLMCLCIYAMVARRTSRLFGVVACFDALPLLPYVYSFEARPYGLMAGLCALAFHGWMLIGEGERNIFRAVSDGTVERVRRHFSIPFGFGGLTLPERGNPIPCRLLIGEMIRLSCNFSFLRRSFFRDTGGENLPHHVGRIQRALRAARGRSGEERERDKAALDAAIGGWEGWSSQQQDGAMAFGQAGA